MSIIDDGAGSGRSAKVGIANRLHTHALNAGVEQVSSIEGNAFDVNSGLVTLTSDAESGILYIMNNEDKDIAVITQFVLIGASTGGAGIGTLYFYLNPTTGTLISNAIDANVFNRRVGDSSVLAVGAYKGVEGDTVTNGDSIPSPTAGGLFNSLFIIPKGAAFALGYKPATGNTSVEIQFGFEVIRDYSKYTIE